MDYKLYLSGLKNSIRYVNRAVKSGVTLSRRENFDFMFKKSLAVAEGMRKPDSFLGSKIKSFQNIDYSIARFMSDYLSEAMDYVEEGYSFKDLKYFFKCMISDINGLGIGEDRYRVFFDDVNNVMEVCIYCHKYEYTVNVSGVDSFISNFSELVSVLVKCDDEWIKEYLIKELTKIREGMVCKQYVEKEKVIKDLRTYSLTDRKQKVVVESSSNVIAFRA